ncbi:MAG: 3-methyladenine DNA glycosylase [Nocardioides sp.]|nr:3-methyladenine DNA glycosylase [Nocardioides sp.]
MSTAVDERARASVLGEAAWHARRDAHERRVDAWTSPHLERRRTGEAHPVHDFLFTYYSQRPAALRRWHPGHGVVLAGDTTAYDGLKGYAATSGGVTVPEAYVASQARMLRTLRTLLVATAARPAQLGCFGLHEWAMVYRLDAVEVRHSSWPLRLGAAGTDAVVEQHRIRCTHFDAYRFFTEPARPLNVLSPGRDDRAEHEQPGCLHAGMDLYKHAFRLTPMIASELVADCFALAREIRELDMRASPYDLSALGYDPVPIETAAGKQAYVEAQQDFVERGSPLRQRLVEECDRLLAVGD